MIKSITILIWSGHVATVIFQLQSMTSDKNHILFKPFLTYYVTIYYISMIFLIEFLAYWRPLVFLPFKKSGTVIEKLKD